VKRHPFDSRVLCVAAHPDDEVLGAGATMSRLVDEGATVHSFVLGEGIGARYRDEQPDRAKIAALHSQLARAAEVMGVVPHHESLPDNRFDQVDLLDIIHMVEEIKREVQPDVVLTHHAGDLNVDHNITARAVLTAFRPLPEEHPVTVLGFETLSSTEWNVASHAASFVPNWFEDAKPGLQRKMDAMAAYSMELREFPHPRSITGIELAARRWGMTVGLHAAEPFILLRHVASDRVQAPLLLRHAAPGDQNLLFRWRNDPVIVRLGSQQRSVTTQEHCAWFERQMTSTDSSILIGESGGIPIGQARFDRSGTTATISIYLAPGLESRGLGVPFMTRACHHAFREWPIESIVACVRLDNERALGAFARSGFERLDAPADCPPAHARLVRSRPGTRAAR